MSTTAKYVIGLVVLVAVIVGLVFIIRKSPNPGSDNQVACTMEAKLCPDGSSVGRTGPMCEFALCPGETPGGSASTAGWKTFSDSIVSFKYSEQLATKYIHAQDWPPSIQINDGPFSCKPAGTQTARAGQTSRVTIAGRAYCVNKIVEGAAGSTYTLYTYATAVGDQVAIASFSLKFVQCDNFDETESSQCKTERAAFDPNPMVNQMFGTLIIK